MKTIVYAIAILIGVVGADLAQAKTSPLQIDGAKTIDAAMAKQLFDDGVPFIDVHKLSDYEAGRIPGANHLELKKVLSEDLLVAVSGKDTAIIIYCNGENCMRSSKASAKAVEWGFTKIYYFRDGMPAWELAGYPVE